MKKKLLCIAGILAVLAVIATLVGPGVILSAVRQPEPEDGFAYAESFRTDYEDIRLHLQELSDGLGAEFASHPIDESDGLYIDTVYLPSNGEYTNLVVLTTGVHGMEGYIGSVMLDVFFEERVLSDFAKNVIYKDNLVENLAKIQHKS